MPRTIEWSGRFTRDYKRERRGQHRQTPDDAPAEVLDAIADGQPWNLDTETIP